MARENVWHGAKLESEQLASSLADLTAINDNHVSGSLRRFEC